VSTATAVSRFGREVRAICGPEYVVEDPPELHCEYIAALTRAVALTPTAAVAVTPSSADEIVAVLRFANEHGLSVCSRRRFYPAARGQSSAALAGVPGKPSTQTGFGALTYTTSPPTGLLGVGLGGDSSPRMIAFQARLEF